MSQVIQNLRRVTTTDAAMLDALLSAAVEDLIPEALRLNHGIKVIRVGPGDYTLEHTADVPCGYTILERS